MELASREVDGQSPWLGKMTDPVVHADGRGRGPVVLVAGWAGSDNLGDEMVLSALLRQLQERGARPLVLSVDPSRTTSTHSVPAVHHLDAIGIAAAMNRSDALVLGGGGILQDETSPWNLPYHLSRAWAAFLWSVPFATVGVGVGALQDATSRWLVSKTLARATRVTVRDAGSGRLLDEIGMAEHRVTADLSFSLQPEPIEASDRIAVALRPWRRSRSAVPAAGGQRLSVPQGFERAAAEALDEIHERTGLEIDLVSFHGDRDDRLHRRILALMDAPASCLIPDLASVFTSIGRARLVIGMRYHAGVVAALMRRPAVLLPYSMKVSGLAADLDMTSVPPDVLGLRDLPDAVSRTLGAAVTPENALQRMRDRERGNGAALDALLTHVS